MKYRLLRFSLLSMLVMLCGGLAQAADPDVTYDFTGSDWTVNDGTLSNGTVSFTGAGSANFKMNSGYFMMGKIGAYINFPTYESPVSKIVVTGRSGASASVIQNIYVGETAVSTETTGAASSNTYEIAEASQAAGTQYTLKVTSNHNTQITKIEVYFADGGGGGSTKTATTVTLAEGYATSGVVGGTIDLPTATVKAGDTPIDALVTWTSSNEDVAKINGSTINLLAAGTAKITASYAGDDANEASSASFTVTIYVPYTTIAAMLKNITTTKTNASYTFENLLVRYVNGKYTYVTDGKDNMLFYGSDLGLVAGDIIKGSVKGQLYTYSGLPELSLNASDITVEVASSNNEVIPSIIELDALANNINNYITIENATYVSADNKKLTFKIGENSFIAYNQFGLDVTGLEADKVYNITGFGSINNSTNQIYPTSIEEVATASGFRDFAVNLTNADAIPTTSNSFGVKVAEDGTYTAVAADDATANFTVNAARFNDAQHGWVNCTFTIPVTGPVLIKLGDCQFGAQTGKITDAEGNVTELTKPAKQCWAAGKPDENVVATYYRGLSATTLTVTYEGYCPFISVTAIDPADLPAEVVKHTVTFAAGEATGEVPAAIEDEEGAKITLPTNFTLYVEGKTLTAWSDGENTFAPGAEYTIPEADATLTAVFTENEVSLADRTEAVTLNFSFRRDQGAPIVQWENTNGHVWVTQATVNGKTIDVPMTIDTNPGKFNNKNNTDCTQTNNGTVFTVPSCKGAEVTMECHGSFSISTTTIDGQTDYEGSGTTTIKQTIAGSAESIQIAIGDGSYYRYVKVVLPVVQSQGGKTYTNEAATIEWPFDDSNNVSANTATPNGVFSTVAANTGDLTITGVGTRTADDLASGITFIKLKPAGSTSAAQWVAKPAAGLTFTPTKVSMWIQRFGTDAENGVTITAKVGEGEAITLGNFTAPRANKNQADDKYGKSSNWTNHVEIELTAEQQAALTSGDELTLSATIGVGSTKEGGFSDVIIEGLINGTAADVAKYTLAVAAAPEDAGTVSKYPAADEYEAGSEVKLTATENFGYDFVNWTDAEGTVVSEESVFTYTMNADATLTANFKAVETYELALTVDGTNDYMVTVSPAPTVVDGKNMYEAGTTVELTANQYEGLVTFTNWSDGETASNKIIKMEDNVTITAVYAQADIIAGWDFYKAGNSGRKADFAAQDNDADALSLVNTETGEASGWLDKSTLGGGGYESFKGAAVNWRTGASNGDVGNWHWQTKVNAEAFTDINVQFQMVFNYNAYPTYNVEYSLDGEQWVNAGSITMARREIASFKGQLPAEANNQAELYIRMIADKTSELNTEVPSKNDGNTLAMFFITGTPKLVDDPVAPALVSSVPAEGATGTSARGKIVLTFDKKVQVAEGTKATLGALELTPAVSGKVITFEYKGLEYSTEYTFNLPANTVSNLTGATLAEAITLTFTTMTRPTVTKGLYDQVVSTADELVAAIAAAQARADKNVRYRIFIKNGEYTIPLSQTTKTVNGYEVPECITFINTQNLSLIGESRDGVIITNGIDKNATFAGTYGTTSKYDGIGNSDVFQLSGSDYYFQDLTIESGMEDGTGRDLAIQDKATRTIYKNTGLRGYQDTWTSNNNNGLYYFEGGYLRGRTDYMCGKGDAFFNGVELRQIYGGYAAVPSNSIKYGYVYKDCVINGEESPAVYHVVNGVRTPYTAAEVDGNYTLGRPWGKGTPSALFIDTKMNVVPSAIGWNEMSGGYPKRFAEYNSTTSTGSVIDLSGRKKTFDAYDSREEQIVDGQKTYIYTNRRDEANNPVLTAEEALEAGNMSNMFGDWDPTLATEQAPVPANVKLAGTTLTWDDSNYALLYAIVKNGSVVDFTTEATFTVDDATATYAVRAANEMGGLGEAAEATAVEEGPTAYEFVASEWQAGDAARISADNVTVDAEANTITVDKTGQNNVALIFRSANTYTVKAEQRYFVIKGTGLSTAEGANYLWWLNNTNNGSQIAPTATYEENGNTVFAWDCALIAIGGQLGIQDTEFTDQGGWSTTFGLTLADEAKPAVISYIGFETTIPDPVQEYEYEFVASEWPAGDPGRISAANVTVDETANTITVNATGDNNVALNFKTDNVYYITKPVKYFVIKATGLSTEEGKSYLWWLNAKNNGAQVVPTSIGMENGVTVFAWDITTDATFASGFNAEGKSYLDGTGASTWGWTTTFGMTLADANVPAVISYIGYLPADAEIPTGISTLKVEMENGTVYNLNGQKVNKAKKGLYIINGRKVVIK